MSSAQLVINSRYSVRRGRQIALFHSLAEDRFFRMTADFEVLIYKGTAPLEGGHFLLTLDHVSVWIKSDDALKLEPVE